jgi:DNA-binding response OmpR family regulator
MPCKKASVLIVDDDPSISRMIRRALEMEGYRVLTAASGQSALDVLEQETPDLVLLDIAMPGMDGYTVCRRLRQSSEIPIIIVTVKDDTEEKVAGLEAGADDYVVKPFSTAQLVARVKAVLRRARLWDERDQLASCRANVGRRQQKLGEPRDTWPTGLGPEDWTTKRLSKWRSVS